MPSERLSRWHLTAMDISLSDYFSKSATALYTTSPSTMFSPALSAASSQGHSRVIGTGPLVHYFGSTNLPLRFAGGGGIMKKNKTC